VIAAVVTQAERFGVQDREWIDELEIDGHDDDFSASTMVILGLATAELRTAPTVLNLDSSRPYAVHTVLSRADQLRGQFAALGSRASQSAAS
jgi:hypothetical protein